MTTTAANLLFRRALAVLAAVVILGWAMLPGRIEIIGPRLGMPAINTPGETIRIEVRASWLLIDPLLYVELSNGAQKLPLEVTSSSGLLPQRSFTAALPDNVPPGAYDLKVKVAGAALDAPRAVHILERFPANFKIVHIADLPVFGTEEKDGEKQMRTLVDEINIIHPDLVIASGDIAYGESWENYRTLYDFLLQIDAPIIVGPGNHEFEAWNGYLEFFGQRYHSIPFGRWQMITLDSSHRRDQLTYSQLRWLEDQLTAHRDGPSLVNLHHPLFMERGLQANVDPIMAALSAHDVQLVLSGHNHGDRLFDNQGQRRLDTWQLPGPLNIVTTSAGARIYPKQSDSPLHHGYRLVRIEGDRITNFTYDYDGDGERDATASIPIGNLVVDQTAPGVAVLENRLYEDFSNVRLRISAGSAGLQPDRGRLISVTESGDEYLYTVELPELAARSAVTVRLLDRVQPGIRS